MRAFERRDPFFLFNFELEKPNSLSSNKSFKTITAKKVNLSEIINDESYKFS
jgi:hypothetical protein